MGSVRLTPLDEDECEAKDDEDLRWDNQLRRAEGIFERSFRVSEVLGLLEPLPWRCSSFRSFFPETVCRCKRSYTWAEKNPINEFCYLCPR